MQPPEAERRLASELVADRVVPQLSHAAVREDDVDGYQAHPHKGGSEVQQRPGPAVAGAGRDQGRERGREELGGGRQPEHEAAASR